MVYNIIIFGTGVTSKMVMQGLKANVNVLYFCDNNQSKWNQEYNNRLIIAPDSLLEIKFDYIIIASQFNEEIYNQLIGMGINKNKIFEFFKYIDNITNYVQMKLSNFESKKNELEGIVTGISYAERGINEGKLARNIFNIANRSQDLYYDFYLVKYLISNYSKNMINLKYLLICLSYYSFEYDMSKSSMKGKVVLYNEVLGKSHHLENINEINESYYRGKKIAVKLLELLPCGWPDVDFMWFNQDSYNHDANVNEAKGKYLAELDGNKNYPETVKENTQILNDYMKLLKENNIKPIIVVCPVTKHYSKYFPNRLKDEFHSIINDVKREYNFQFLDYFDCDLFNDDDFYDVSHLNDKGAEKFTRLLNNKIEW